MSRSDCAINLGWKLVENSSGVEERVMALVGLLPLSEILLNDESNSATRTCITCSDARGVPVANVSVE